MALKIATVRTAFLCVLIVACNYLARDNTNGCSALADVAEGNRSTTRYRYNKLGTLHGVDLADGTKVEYLNDAMNRRIGKKINGKFTQGFIWQSPLRPAAELDGDGKVVSQFVYATETNVPDYMKRAGKTYRLICDDLGSVRLVVDVSSGEIAQRLDYDEFGNVLQDTKPGFQPFGFAGGLYDPQTKLVRLGARDYDPTAGRWTGKDPIGFSGGDTNLYAYVGNDPLNRVDPEGLQTPSTGSQGAAQPQRAPFYERLQNEWEPRIDRLADRYSRGWTIYEWRSSEPPSPGRTYRWRISFGSPGDYSGLSNRDRYCIDEDGNLDRGEGFGLPNMNTAGTANDPRRIGQNPTRPDQAPSGVVGIKIEWWQGGPKQK